MYIHVYPHTHIHIYIHMLCMYVHVYKYVYIHIHTYIYIYLYTHISLSIYIYIYVCVYIYIHMFSKPCGLVALSRPVKGGLQDASRIWQVRLLRSPHLRIWVNKSRPVGQQEFRFAVVRPDGRQDPNVLCPTYAGL